MTRIEELLQSIEGVDLMNRMLEDVERDKHLCVTCRRRPRLDGHLTCGNVHCNESDARARMVAAWQR